MEFLRVYKNSIGAATPIGQFVQVGVMVGASLVVGYALMEILTGYRNTKDRNDGKEPASWARRCFNLVTVPATTWVAGELVKSIGNKWMSKH